MNQSIKWLLPLLASVVLATTASFANAQTTGESRAEVKSEARDALKKGQLPLRDDGTTPAQEAPAKFASAPSNTTRGKAKPARNARKPGAAASSSAGTTP